MTEEERRRCIILGICSASGSDAQVWELARLVQTELGSFSATDEPSERAIAVAQAIFKDFDLVPRGVGQGIASGYAAFLKKE